jgi:predicted ATPase
LELIGRDGEQRLLDELVASATEGMSSVLVLRGEAGAGKSTLLDYALRVADGMRSLRVVGVEDEMGLGFAGLHRLLLPLLSHLDVLPEPQRDALGAAFGLGSGQLADRFLVALAALTLVTDAAADQPVVCIVDDAQWLDSESLEAIAFVGRRLHADRVVLLIGVREPTEGRVRLDGLPELRLGGLAEREAHELLRASSGTEFASELADRIVAYTNGNPLAIVELAHELTSYDTMTAGR